ncbi:Protein ACS-14 [Aphelenchoides avenae]|nr:Protein ACS-14 [Aphelenchus avenae]
MCFARHLIRQCMLAVLPNCWHYAPIFVGVALRGGIVSGASYLFTDYELLQQFLDSKTEVVFCADSTLERVLKAAKNAPRIKTIIVVNDSKKEVEYPFGVVRFLQVLGKEPRCTWPVPQVDVNRDLLLLPYSRHFGKAILPVLDPSWDWTKQHMLMMLPFYHIYGFGFLTYALLNGATGVIMKQFNTEVYCGSIQKYKIRLQLLVPPILVFLAKHPIVSKYDLSSLTFLLCAAAPAGPDLCEEVRKRLPHVKYIAQGYGMTEVSMGSHVPLLDKPRYSAAGKLGPNLEMKVTDIETGKEVPRGEKGEICIRGDVGYVDEEGFLYIVDRIKELIKVKGLQVPPAELEDLLLSHPDIRDCAVIGIPDARSGEVPKAFVVKGKDRLTEKQVIDYVKKRVAAYKQLQGGVEFINEIPKSAAGKILRRVLRDRSKATQSVQSKL